MQDHTASKGLMGFSSAQKVERQVGAGERGYTWAAALLRRNLLSRRLTNPVRLHLGL